MFKWLKNLFHPVKLIPKDVENGLMTSMYYTIKLGEKLNVPNNCVCFLSYKDRLYAKFDAGEHVLDESCLANLTAKQAGSVKNKKTVKFDLFFVNLNNFSYPTSQKESVPVDKKLCKLELKTNFCCNVVDAVKFQKYALSFYALIRPIDAQHLVQSFVEENINKYYLKRSLTTPIDNLVEAENLKAFLNKKGEKIGLNFSKLELSIWNKSKQIDTQSKKFYFENIVQNKPNESTTSSTPSIQQTVDKTKEKEYSLDVDNNTQEKVEPQEICPICKCKRISNAPFCHKCGFKF